MDKRSSCALPLSLVFLSDDLNKSFSKGDNVSQRRCLAVENSGLNCVLNTDFFHV